MSHLEWFERICRTGNVEVLKKELILEKELSTQLIEGNFIFTKYLQYAVWNNHNNFIIFLLDNNLLNVNRKIDEGGTILHIAVMKQNTKLVNYLLDLPNIDIFVKDITDTTPIDMAENRGYLKIAVLLRGLIFKEKLTKRLFSQLKQSFLIDIDFNIND
ncbi:hypothetical protein ABK040_011536 [Willaertia magna]